MRGLCGWALAAPWRKTCTRPRAACQCQTNPEPVERRSAGAAPHTDVTSAGAAGADK